MTRGKCPRPGRVEVVFHDRYSVTGTPRPDPKTMCKKCEGMKFHPTKCGCGGKKAAHKQQEPPMEDWCWVSPCQTCKGTGLDPEKVH